MTDPLHFQTPNPARRSFARTNAQTIAQRAALLTELLPNTQSIVEICCGDCSGQKQIYTEQLGIQRFAGLDLEPEIVQRNQQAGIECVCGNALDPKTLQQFLVFDVIFFGPPLSVECDGHQLFTFQEVVPSYEAFSKLLIGELGYKGSLICIGPRTTRMGDITRLYEQMRAFAPNFNLRLIHHTYATLTGSGEVTEPRLKYVELWFSPALPETWEVRESRPPVD